MSKQDGSAVTDSVRVAYTLRKLRRWLDNYETNGARYVRECAAHAQDVRDVIAMLDGSEDDYISRVMGGE